MHIEREELRHRHRHAVEHLLERAHRGADAVLLDQRDQAVGDPGAARQFALRQAVQLAHVFETGPDVDGHDVGIMICRWQSCRSRTWPPNPNIQPCPTSTPTGCRSRRIASSRASRACWRARRACTTRRPRAGRFSTASPGCGASTPGTAARKSRRPWPQQLEVMDYAPPFQMGHPAAFELANAVVRIAPAGLDHVFFTNSGSESVDTALKIALAYHRVKGDAARVRLHRPRARLSRRGLRRHQRRRHGGQSQGVARRR